MDFLNYADNPEIVKKVEFLIDIYQSVKTERKWLEDEWERWENIWALKRDYYKYEPILSEVYIPIIRKKTEDAINEISNKLIPFGDNFVVYPMPGTPEQYADAVKKMLQYQFFEEMKVNIKLKPVLRDLIIKGTAVAKIYWEKDQVKFKPVNIKDNFYVYPQTAEDVDDALITFERIIVDKYELEYMAELGKYKNIEKLSEVGDFDVKDTLTSGKYVKQYKELPYYEIVECYTKIKLKDDEPETPVIISFEPKSKTIIQITPSPYVVELENGEFEDFKPYLSLQFIKLIDSFYGASLYSQIQYLQYMINDVANLMIDNAVLVQSPIVKVDPAKVQNMQSLVYAPGAMWLCEADGAIFDRPPSLLGEGITTFQQLKLLTEEYSNIGGFMPMTTKRTTATEVAIYSQMMTTFIQTIVSDIETQFLTPLLKKVFYLDQLYMNNRKLKKLLGTLAIDAGIKGKERRILKKEYGFRWIGTLQSMNIFVRNQQLMNLIQILANIPQEVIGGKVNWLYLIKELWKSLGNTDIDNIVQKVDKEKQLDPMVENEYLVEGKEVDVGFYDDDWAHITLHNEASVNYQEDESIYNLFVSHIRKHLQQLQQKVALSQQMQQQVQPKK